VLGVFFRPCCDIKTLCQNFKFHAVVRR
jgi:hypothetical protein